MPGELLIRVMCIFFLSISFSGCASSGKVYSHFGGGPESISAGWTGYYDEGYGVVAAYERFQFKEFAGIPEDNDDSSSGLYLGVTKKLNEQWGAHLGLCMGESSGIPAPSGGPAMGLDYLTENGWLIGFRTQQQSQSFQLTVGIDDPLVFLDALIGGDDDDDVFGSHK